MEGMAWDLQSHTSLSTHVAVRGYQVLHPLEPGIDRGKGKDLKPPKVKGVVGEKAGSIPKATCLTAGVHTAAIANRKLTQIDANKNKCLNIKIQFI